MIDNSFRAFLPRFVQPLIKIYKYLNLTANQISILGFLFSLLSAYMITRGFFLLALALWWIGRIFDGTDGIYARQTMQNSDFGAFLDILLDMTSYSIIILAFNFAFPDFQIYWMVILFFYVLCITSALALGRLEDASRNKTPIDNRGLRLAAGIAEGGETGIAYSLFLVFPGHLLILIKIWIAVLFMTNIARVFLAKKELTK